jgi:hypothetical protein
MIDESQGVGNHWVMSIGISRSASHAQKQKELRCFYGYDMSTAKWKL